jgi:hypothetical protein
VIAVAEAVQDAKGKQNAARVAAEKAILRRTGTRDLKANLQEVRLQNADLARWRGFFRIAGLPRCEIVIISCFTTDF